MVRRTFNRWGFALFFGALIALIAAEASEASISGRNIGGPEPVVFLEIARSGR